MMRRWAERGSVSITWARRSRRSARCSVNDFQVPRQAPKISPRQAESARHVVEIEIGISVLSLDRRQDRAQSRGLHTTCRDKFCGVGGRAKRRGDEVKQMAPEIGASSADREPSRLASDRK